MNTKKTIWIAAGGTGGHISPAVAVADALQKKGHHVVFFTLPSNLDYPDLKAREKSYSAMLAYDAPQIVKNPLKFFSFFSRLLQCWILLKRVCKNHAPDAVIGFGGYPSFPALLWARFNAIAYYLQEQNAAFGLVTRLMKKNAKKVFLAFPKERYLFNEVCTGNPLREAFHKLKKTKANAKIKNILILGGSQGASDLNNLYLEMAQRKEFSGFTFTISCGAAHFERIDAQKRKKDRVFAFIENMAEEMQKADLILSRAGAGLLFEILAASRPSVLFPYPYATDDHQKENAGALVAAGLAEIIDLRPFDAAKAADQIHEAINSKRMETVSKNLSKHTFPLNAALKIAEEVTA